MPVRWEHGEVCEVGKFPKIKDDAGRIVNFSYRVVRWYGREHFQIRVGDAVNFVRRGKKFPDRASSVSILLGPEDFPAGFSKVTHEKSTSPIMNDINSTGFCVSGPPGPPRREPPITPRENENCPELPCTFRIDQLTHTSSQPPSLESPTDEVSLTGDGNRSFSFIISRLEENLKVYTTEIGPAWHPLGSLKPRADAFPR